MALAENQGLAKRGTFLPKRVNQYVPAMQFHANVDCNSRQYRVSFGAPAVADANGIVAAQSIAAAGQLVPGDAALLMYELDAPFGRCVQVVADGVATSAVEISGRDYLGQPMYESFTLNGTTPVIGVKAFKWIDVVKYAATASRSIDVGTTDKLGLPFKTAYVLAEFEDGVKAATTGTLVAGVRTDPQTATTVDPRGSFDPNGTLDATAVFDVLAVADPYINSSGNGGLHGIKHYYEVP